MSKVEYMGHKAAIGLALGERNAGLDAFRVLLFCALLGCGVGIVGYGVRSLEPMLGMAIEATLPLAGFLLASRLSGRSDGSPRTLFTLWKAVVRIMPVYALGLLTSLTLAMKAGAPIRGGVLHVWLAGTLLGSRQDDLVWAWPIAVVWWGHIALTVLSQLLRCVPWACERHRNVWLSGWLVVLAVPAIREVMWRRMSLEAVDLVHGAVWRLDSVAWGVVAYGILRRFPDLGSRRSIRLSGAVGVTGLGLAALSLAVTGDWSGHRTLLGLLQCTLAISVSLLLPWLSVWRVPWESRTRSWLELVSRMSYPFFVSFLLVFQAGRGKTSGWFGAEPLQRSLSACLLSLGLAWVIAGFVQPVLNRLLLEEARRVRVEG